jgi:hypothetical protein
MNNKQKDSSTGSAHACVSLVATYKIEIPRHFMGSTLDIARKQCEAVSRSYLARDLGIICHLASPYLVDWWCLQACEAIISLLSQVLVLGDARTELGLSLGIGFALYLAKLVAEIAELPTA